MNNDEEQTFSCPRCGSDVNLKARYCMKCGYLNPAHPENKQYVKYLKGNKEGYSVSQDGVNSDLQINVNEATGKLITTEFGSNMGNFTLCFIINLLCYALLVVGSVAIFYYACYGDVYTILGSELCFLLFIISIVSIYLYSTQLVYMKMNRHWWAALVPFVNLYALSDAIYGKKLLNLLVFVPVVGQIYLLVLFYKMGKEFRYNGLLTLLFTFIMYPVIGYGGSAFRNVCYLSGRDSLEKEYTKKKFFLIINVVVIVCSIIMYIYSNVVDINRGMDRFSSYYIYFASQRVITRTKLKVENNVYLCDGTGDTLYFHFEDLSDYFNIPFYVYRDPIQGYMKVEIIRDAEGQPDQYIYSISMTDGRYGFAETPVSEFEMESVVPFGELDPNHLNGNQCYFRRNA